MQEVVSSRRMPLVLRPLAGAQELVVTRSQLEARGIGWEGVAARTRHGVWRDLGPRVVLLHSGELTRRQRAWAATLHAGPRSALARTSALELGGLCGYEEWTVHVAVPHGSEVSDLEHPLVVTRVHQTRYPDQDVVPERTPARHSINRATIEAASSAQSADRARALVAAVVQQRLARPVDLDAFLDSRRTLPRRQLLRETVADAGGGAHSLPEIEFARALRAAALPEPTRQLVVATPGGRYYLDNDFEPWLVTVEINGSQHDTAEARDHDDARRGELQRGGRLVVDVSAHLVRHHPREAVLRTADALISRGWVPSDHGAAILATYRAM